MRRVILESPYAGDVEMHVLYARLCVRDSLARGEAPIASHLLYTQPGILNDDVPAERQWGIDAGLAWRSVAQASVVYLDFGISKGMQYGIDAARSAGIPVKERRLPTEVFRAWRQTAAQALLETRQVLRAGQAPCDVEALQAEVARLTAILNTPKLEPFLEAAASEARHQIYRWGAEHDATKTAWDWFWTLGYLGSKAAHAALIKDWRKAKHHTITAAALLANWHRHICVAADASAPSGSEARDG